MLDVSINREAQHDKRYFDYAQYDTLCHSERSEESNKSLSRLIGESKRCFDKHLKLRFLLLISNAQHDNGSSV